MTGSDILQFIGVCTVGWYSTIAVLWTIKRFLLWLARDNNKEGN